MPNRQEVLSSLNIIFYHLLQLQFVYWRVHWILLRLWTSDSRFFLHALRDFRLQAQAKDTPLMSWQQPCTSPTTRAGVQVISTCGWSKMSVVLSRLLLYNVKLKVIYRNMLNLRLK